MKKLIAITSLICLIAITTGFTTQRVNSYTYARMENGLEQGTTTFEAANNREAQQMAEQWFYSSVESITA